MLILYIVVFELFKTDFDSSLLCHFEVEASENLLEGYYCNDLEQK